MYKGPLPAGIRIMNPYREVAGVMEISSAFYRKYYDDKRKRHLVLGINPGRFGAGLTGIPFTDPKRLQQECGIPYAGKITHEPSSVFMYEMIGAYGGAEKFYGDFYIGAVCPLGFTSQKPGGREVNYNYYDQPELTELVKPFIVTQLKRQIALGVYTDHCICLGKGKNEKFLQKLNSEYGFFGRITALEHPRFIMQYRSASKHDYIRRYLDVFNQVISPA